MSTTYRVFAAVPTVYQSQSIRAFGMPVKKTPEGGFIAEQAFDSREEAVEFLKERAWIYNNEDGGSEDELNEMYEDAENGHLSLDAATAHIEEVEKN